MSSSSNVENIPPYLLRLLSQELSEQIYKPPEGIRGAVNEEDVTDIEATIEGPKGTQYASGVFKLRLVPPIDFPASPPRSFFTVCIFHPVVAMPSGEICVRTLKNAWKSDQGLPQILPTVKCPLIVSNAGSAFNADAGLVLPEMPTCLAKHKGSSSPQNKAVELAKEKKRALTGLS